MSTNDWTPKRATDLAAARVADAMTDGATPADLVEALRAAGLPVVLETPELRDLLDAARVSPDLSADPLTRMEGDRQLIDPHAVTLLKAAVRWRWHGTPWARQVEAESAATPKTPRALPFGYAMAHPDGLPKPQPGMAWQLIDLPGVTPSAQEWREVLVPPSFDAELHGGVVPNDSQRERIVKEAGPQITMGEDGALVWGNRMADERAVRSMEKAANDSQRAQVAKAQAIADNHIATMKAATEAAKVHPLLAEIELDMGRMRHRVIASQPLSPAPTGPGPDGLHRWSGVATLLGGEE